MPGVQIVVGQLPYRHLSYVTTYLLTPRGVLAVNLAGTLSTLDEAEPYPILGT